ncbi:uncharacterized protein LOC110094391 [Dendrobium catenatum]|uniref:Uncharacterized protein n=1 Tax=Dendrobium catenatum TaxID=906689 RepID=A0A2I0V9L4_9ASPA|nr:uncharacterized protein LOC110094391 [Dendrobium catenatum]PKU60094.1 hypothetical protein MA16_Dca020492 [Dendrobium catenatum]
MPYIFVSPPLNISLFSSIFLSSNILPQQNTMNPYGEDNLFCYFHPKEFLVGVCALCLKERLLILASKQSHVHLPKNANNVFQGLRRKPSIALPKVFALGSFFHRFEARNQNPDEENNEEGSITSHEDSFISIKFEPDGRGSWENVKNTSERSSWLASGKEDKLKEINGRINSVVEKAKLQSGLRWRKKIGQLIQLARWIRSSKAGVSHTGITRKVERVRGRRGWIRSLTRRAISSTD